MAVIKIAYTNKEDYREVALPEKNRVVAADMNELKSKFNALLDLLKADVRKRVSVVLTSSNFTAGVYTNNDLIGLTPMVDFSLFSNDGTGALLKVNDGYTFNGTLGKITCPAGNYNLIYYKPLDITV